MSMSDRARDLRAESESDEPADIEALLPWYAAGTLRRRERQRVEEALRGDPELARHADLVREELAETIFLNESLGAPSAHAIDRLMGEIDHESSAARKRGSFRGMAARFGTYVASFSPRTLAVAASVATLAIAVQAFALIGVLTEPGSFETASSISNDNGHGTFAMVRFARQASAAEITKFLQEYQAALVDGPKADGLYRIRIAIKNLASGERGRIVSKMQHEHVIEYAEPSE
ncbi:MAG TPA: hypothetical protein VMJ52_20010 [Xanthobacteraceae bacterium]|nr:hypothetical protein [Xanthobacteraceae bacterium]